MENPGGVEGREKERKVRLVGNRSHESGNFQEVSPKLCLRVYSDAEMRNSVQTRVCPECKAEVPTAWERCSECQQLLIAPPLLPLLRRPGAGWALAAILLGLLGIITWGLLAWLAVPALVMAWRHSQQRAVRTLCPGVRLLVGLGVLTAILGIGIGFWSIRILNHPTLTTTHSTTRSAPWGQ